MRVRKPRIGISACRFPPDAARSTYRSKTLLFIEQSVAHELQRFGARAYMLPTLPATMGDAADLLADLDGLVLHGGVPFAISTGKHYSCLAIPEATLGFSKSSVKGANNDISVSGFHLDLGARAGAEVHFGFIDLPQLSLQATVGVALTYDHSTLTNGNNESSRGATAFGTTVQNEPWSIFRSSVAALYYF